MAKRFTDTEKWRSPFMKTLPAEYRLLWLYIQDDCDIAGIWTLDFEVASLRLGFKLSIEKAKQLFAEHIVEIDGGNKWFMPGFLKMQYRILSCKNKAQLAVLRILEANDLIEYVKTVDTLLEPHHEPHHEPHQDIDKEKDKDKDKEQDKEKPAPAQKISQPKELPFQTTATSVRIPTLQEVQEYFVQHGCTDKQQPQRFYNYYDGIGWQKGTSHIQKWTAFADTWIRYPLSADKLARPAPALPAAAQLLETRGL